MKAEKIKIPIIGEIDSKTEKVTYYKEPKHVRDGIAKAKKLKEEDVYSMIKEAYVGSFTRGDEYDSIRLSHLGGTFGDFEGHYSTQSNGKVEVRLADNRLFIFSLRDIFEEITKLKGRQTKLF